MAGISTGAGAPVVKVYHEKSMILPDVSRVLACLYEKDVEFETVKDSYKDILRLQATRSVPVPFYDGPTFLQESRAICRYIAETYEQRGYPFLLGKDVLERASIEQWLRHEEHAFDPPSRALFCHLAFPLHDEGIDDIAREKRRLEEVLEVYEQRLGESEFLAGNKFTLADLVHLPNTHHIVTSEKFAYLYDSRKNVQRWWNTISARNSWQQVVRDMKSVEEQHQWEEFEQHQWEEFEQQQQQQWQPLPTSGGHSIRIDPRKQAGTDSRTILVPPPSGGVISSSFFTVPQEEQPLPAETTSHGEPPAIERKESNFVAAPERTPPPSKQRTSTTHKSPSNVQGTTSNFFTPATLPTTNKMPQRTDTDKSTSKDASPPTRPSQGSSKEAPDKLNLSDFYKASNHTDEAATIAKPTPYQALKTSDSISVPRQTSEVVALDKPSPASAKAPHEIDGPDPYETESKPASIDPWVDNPVPYDKPDSQTPKSPYTRSAAQRDANTNGPEAGETSSDQRRVVQTPYAQQPSEQAKKASADQRAAAHLPEHVTAKDVQGEPAPQARQRDAKDITKEAREADQKRTTSAPSRELPSGSQNIPQQSKAPPTDLKVSDLSPLQAEYEDTKGAVNGDEQFSTKRLRKMLEQSDAEALKPQSTDLQAPPKQDETPSIYKKPSYVQDRKGQAGNISADEKTDGTPSTSTRAPDTPTSADERRVTSPPKGGMAPDDRGATEPRKSPSINEQQAAPPVPSQSPTTGAWRASASSNGAAQDDDLAHLSTIDQRRPPPIQQGAPGGPSIDKLDKTADVDRRAQQSTPKKTSTEQSDKSAMYERAPAVAPRQAPPSDTSRTSASTPPSQESVSSSQQTTESIKGVTPTLHGITGGESDNIAMADENATPPAPPASDGRSVTTALQGGVLDARGENEAVKPSVADPRGMPTTPKRPAATPDNQRHTTSDQVSDKAPPLSSFAETRNARAGIAEADETITMAPDEQPVGRAPKNAGAPAAGPLPMRSQKNMNEAYSDGASIQQLSSDQSRAQPAENKKKQGGDATLVNEFDKSKAKGFLANANQNNTEQAEATSAAGPSKKQIHSDQNQPISSKDIVQDIGKQTNETVYYRSSATSREMLPSAPKKSMREQQLQGDKSSISPQDNGQQGSEAALPVSGTEQPKERELLTNADQNSGKTPGQALQESEEQTSPDTQQVKNNGSNIKSDGSSKPTQFDGNEDDVPESQRGGSSTNL